MRRLKPRSKASETAPEEDLRIPERGHYTEGARQTRLRWAREQTGATLHHLETTDLVPERLTGNVENLIGSVEIPVGLAGPLWFRGETVEGLIVAPFATTEGSLVASASRGATAISRSGGVATRVLAQRMTRGPLFVLADLGAACGFVRWIEDHRQEIRARVRQVSHHAELAALEPFQIGKTVHLRFVYRTGAAAGQNMTTACTWRACLWLVEHVPFELESFLIEGNQSSDKKVSFQSFLSGRGTRVTAECLLEREVLERVLKVTPEHLERCHQAFLQGSIGAGMVGYNINVANTVAAIFTATGQDIACVHESSLAQLHLEVDERGLYASILLPSLIVGTVGGGTALPAQQELLELLGCAGPGNGERLAEIIAGFSLALDLSTLAAIASGQFATSHERLGRNRPVEWLTMDDLGPAFFEPGLRRTHGDPGLAVTAIETLEHPLGSSIITELTGRRVRKLVGLFPLRLTTRSSAGAWGREDVLVKVKPLDGEVILMLQAMASLCGGHLAALHAQHRSRLGFQGCHLRELAVYEQRDPRFVRHVPRIHHCFRADEREAYVVVMELLEGVELIDSADDVSAWRRRHLTAALQGLAEVQAIWLGRDRELDAKDWLGPVMTAPAMVEMAELFAALATHAAEEFPAWCGAAVLRRRQRLIEGLPAWWREWQAMPRTLVHNDFNPRNLAFRRLDGGGLRLCVWDWELATLLPPQRDLAELLSFVLTPRATREEVGHWVEVHRRNLERASGRKLEPERWRRGYALALFDFAVHRSALYAMAHTFRNYRFLPRVTRTLDRLIDLEDLPETAT